jgi:cytidine deaminase
MNEQRFTIDYLRYDNINQLDEADRILCQKAEQALNTSYSPYSKFRVGTAVCLGNGEIVMGSNQENVAYPSGLCAERVALYAIGANKPGAVIRRMAVTAHTDAFEIDKPVTSCGGCLQVMAEFEQRQGSKIDILFYCINGEILKVHGVQSLLPFAFVENRLSASI